MTTQATDGTPQRSRLESGLSVITDVRPGEGVNALLMTLNLFLLLTAYYVIKPVREALILAMESGAEYKSYMGAAIALALLVVVPIYGAFANRVARNRLVVTVTLFFALHLVLFYLASLEPNLRGNLGLVFYGWVGVFNMMVVAQIWAFANDIYSEEQGKRLFALIGLGASVGAAIGSLVADILIEPVGVYQMLLVSAGMLSVTALITQVVHIRQTRSAGRGRVAESSATEATPSRQGNSSSSPKSKSGSFALVFRHRYLRLLAMFSLVFTLVNTNGEYMLSRLISQYAEELADERVSDEAVAEFVSEPGKAQELIDEEIEANQEIYEGISEVQAREEAARAVLVDNKTRPIIGSLFGNFYLWVNVLGVLLQMFVVSRLVKYFGLSRAFFVLPVIAFLDAAATAVFPFLLVLRIGKTFENSVDYSLNNTLRNMLWLPTSTEMKYKAKQAVDTFFVRMGDVMSAVFVFILAAQLSLGVRAFAVANTVLVALWLALAVAIVREYEAQGRLRAAAETVGRT